LETHFTKRRNQTMTKLKLARQHRERALDDAAMLRADGNEEAADMAALEAEMYGDLIRQYLRLEEETI